MPLSACSRSHGRHDQHDHHDQHHAHYTQYAQSEDGIVMPVPRLSAERVGSARHRRDSTGKSSTNHQLGDMDARIRARASASSAGGGFSPARKSHKGRSRRDTMDSKMLNIEQRSSRWDWLLSRLKNVTGSASKL